MVFNSVTFLVFLAVTLSLYYRLGHRGQNWLLLISSYFFYGWWDFRFVFLLLFTSFFDYFCALWIDQEQNPGKRKMFLSFSIIVNMAVLCIFKYYNFFSDSLRHLLGVLGIHASFPILHVILPVGISFYTFLSFPFIRLVFSAFGRRADCARFLFAAPVPGDARDQLDGGS